MPKSEPAPLPPLSFDVDGLPAKEMKTICEIDPTDSNRFLYGHTLPGWISCASYAFADLSSLLNAPGPPFYAIGKDRADTEVSMTYKVDPDCNENFLCEAFGGVSASYPIAAIPLLITSSGPPFYLPLKDPSLNIPVPGFQGSSFYHESVGMGCKHGDRNTSASRSGQMDGSMAASALGLCCNNDDCKFQASARPAEDNFPTWAPMLNGDPFADIRNTWDGTPSILPPDQKYGFLGASRPLAYCRNYGSCMLQDSLRTAERNLPASGPVLGDDQFTDRSYTFEGLSSFPGAWNASHKCIYPDYIGPLRPTSTPGFDSQHPSRYWPNNSRYVNGYYTPSPHQMTGLIDPYLRLNDSRSIDYTTSLTSASRDHSNKENKPPTCPFCTDFAGTGSWLLNKEETALLLQCRGCAYHRDIVPFSEGCKPTLADSGTLEDFNRSTDDVRNESTKNPGFQEPYPEDHVFHNGSKGPGKSRGNYLTFAEYFNRMTRKRPDFYENHHISGSQARHELANHEDDIEKGQLVDVEKGGEDDKYQPYCKNGCNGKHQHRAGKKVRSMVFWIVVVVLGLGSWFDNMHETDLVNRGVGKGEFGGGMEWEVKDRDEGVGASLQLDPGAPGFGDGSWGASDGKE
ncbi:MAG: hypothetical protein Q9221_003831 [Calogaya cf. arnoldii]